MTQYANLGTLRQYEDRDRRDYCRDNPELTLAEYARNYPPGSRRQEWINAVFDAARDHKSLTRFELDCLAGIDERLYFSLIHDFPRMDYLPPGYLCPRVRAFNRRP